MAINLSGITSRGGAGGGNVSWDFHAMKRDDDGMLIYTKVTGSDTDVIDLVSILKKDENNEMIFRSLDDFTLDPITNQPVIRDPEVDPYFQYKFDSRNLSYFIDSEGYLVARMGQAYDYETNGPK